MAKNHLEFFNVAPCLGVLFPKRNVLLFTRQCDLKIKSYKWDLWSAGLRLNTSPGNMDLNIQLSELQPYTCKHIRQCAKYSDLHIPWANCMTSTQIWYTNIACQSLFWVKIVFPEEKDWFSWTACVLSHKTTSIVWNAAQGLYEYFVTEY